MVSPSKIAIALSLLLASSVSLAECPRTVPGAAPTAPDGAVASRVEMYEAQQAIGAYVEHVEAYLACWDRLLSNASHGMLLDSAETAAESYNTSLLQYRQRADVALVD